MAKAKTPRAPRPRKSAEEQDARGNPGHRATPLVAVEVLPPAAFTPPSYMTPASRDVWNELAPGLIAMKLLRQTDSALFAMLCDSIAEAREAKAVLDEHGYTYETQSEHSPRMVRVHPAYLVLDRARRIVLQYGGHFGLTPAARLTIMTQLANNPNAGAGIPAQGGASGTDSEAATAGLFDESGASVPIKGPLGLLAN